jgi:hypothetical protein
VSRFDEIRNAQSEGEAPPVFEPTIGCPACHGQSGLVVVGRQHIYYCAEHRCFWLGPLVPWARPYSETDAEQREDWNAAGLEGFEQVQPWILGTEGSHPLVGRTLAEIQELAERQKDH